MRHVLALLALAVCLAVPAAHGQSFEDYQAIAAPASDQPPVLEDYGRLAEQYSATETVNMTQREVDRFVSRLVRIINRAPHLGADIHDAMAAASPDGSPSFFAGLFIFLIFLIGIGRAVALLFAVYAARPVFVKMQTPHPQGLVEKLPVLATRVALMAVVLVITVGVAVLVGAGFYPDDNPVAVQTAIIAFATYSVVRLVDVLWRMLLAPYLANYRVPVMGDREARRLYKWLYVTTLAAVGFAGALEWLSAIGLAENSHALLRILSATVTAVLVSVVGWVNRRAVSGALLEGKPAHRATWLARLSAILWGPVVLIYVGVSWAVGNWRLVTGGDPGPPMIAVGFLTFLAALSVYAGIVYVVERLSRSQARRRRLMEGRDDEHDVGAHADSAAQTARFPRDARADGGAMGSDDDEGGGMAPMQATARAAPGGPNRMRTYEDLAKRVASLFALGAAIWSLARFWGGPDVFAQDGVLDRVQDVTDILLIAYIMYHSLRIWIDRKIDEEGGEQFSAEPGDEGGGAHSASRLATLLPLVRNFLLVFIVLAGGIFVLMELGVNVAPLVGGAGIIGLAIGFGSQTLVRDILSGAFFLIDDAFRRGEYIDVGEVKGTVEQISIRSFQLRHHLGALHTIPFGEIRHLTNFSRDWVMMKLPLRLTYDTDPEKVRKLIKKLGQELLEHPEEGHKFVQPLKSQGVYMMEDSAMIIRVKYMTKPGDQWTTRKLVYARIRELFEQEGIHFAHREVTVRLPDLNEEDARTVTPRTAQAIGAAARRAVDDADLALQAPRAVGDDR